MNFDREFSRRYSNASDGQEENQRRTSNGNVNLLDPNSFQSRNRTNSRVSFTIGDSSDCDSGTTTSGSVVTATEFRHNSGYSLPGDEDEDDRNLQNSIGNPWRKYHFHCEENEQTNGNLGMTELQMGRATIKNADLNLNNRPPISEMEEESQSHSPSTSTTGLMIPNYPNRSLARLADVNSVDADDEDGNAPNIVVSCSKGWGKWRILVACAIVQLFSALMVSLQAPFYPSEAEKKGSSALEYGFVFGVFELTVFIVAPFYGSRIHKWNPKLVFHIGIFTAAISSIVFGLLDNIPRGKYFILASAAVRAMEALGESAVITSSFVIVASAFPESVASTFAIVETFYSVGLISGPVVGSVLYQIGGFPLPFLVVGGLLIVAAVLSFIILPSAREISEYQEEEPVIISSYKSFRLLGIAGVSVSAFCIILGALSISYLQATLEPHLRQFGISQLTTGAILVINGGVYTITAPFWGLLCDKVVQLKLVSFCGTAVLACGFSLIGPVPVFHFEQKLWITSLGLTLQGLGLGAVLVSSFVSILQLAIRRGLADSPSTYGLVSSLWTSMFSLGSFMGPSLSGILYDSVGFSNGTLSVIAFAFIMMFILLFYMFISDSELESFVQSETEPLLNSTAISGSVYSNIEPPQPCNTEIGREMNYRQASYGSTSR